MMEKFFLILLGIFIFFFGKAKYDLSKAKKDLSKATSEVIKSSTEYESEKTVLAFKQTITKATQEAQHVTPLCAESPLVDTQDNIPSPPIFKSVNTSEIKKEEQLTNESKEEVLLQLERLRKLRGL